MQIVSQQAIDELTEKYGEDFKKFVTSKTVNLEGEFKSWKFKTWLADCFAQGEKDDAIVEKLHMNPQMFSKFRIWPDDSFSPITQRELLIKGFYGEVWTAGIWVSKDVPKNTIVVENSKGVKIEFTYEA